MTVDLNPMRARHTNGRLPELVAAARGVTPPATGISGLDKPTPADPDGVDQLLARAASLPQARIRTAANRIRSNANFLRTLLADAEKELKLQAEIDRHLTQIDLLRTQLRALAAGHEQEQETGE